MLDDQLAPISLERDKTELTQDLRRKRCEAHPIGAIHDRQTGMLLGWLYQWNTGDIVPMWLDQTAPNKNKIVSAIRPSGRLTRS